MEWYLILLFLFCTVIVLMLTGLPIAFCFMLIILVGAFWAWGEAGLGQVIRNVSITLTSFALLPLPLFILMGEIMFQSGMGNNIVDALDKWVGRVPGRLSLEAVGGGTLFATLSGASIASTAMLGTLLVPEMQKRGYKKSMSLGPILGSGGLAIMIPPSALAVLLGALGEISIGKLLIGIIVPGLLMATLYATYIVTRCYIQPSIAPAYEVPPLSVRDRVIPLVRDVLPLGLVIFMVTGVIFLGIATPSEAAATGAFSAFILAALYRRVSWDIVKRSFASAVEITVMVFMIIAGAMVFSQILAYTGACRGMVNFTLGLPLFPIFILIAMQIILLIMGCFMEVIAIMMITLPIFMPVVHALGFNPVWFGVIYLLNIEMAEITPPFGMSLFVMKGVAPSGTTMGDVYRAALPFLAINVIVMALMIIFPIIVLWLPGMMR